MGGKLLSLIQIMYVDVKAMVRVNATLSKYGSGGKIEKGKHNVPMATA